MKVILNMEEHKICASFPRRKPPFVNQNDHLYAGIQSVDSEIRFQNEF